MNDEGDEYMPQCNQLVGQFGPMSDMGGGPPGGPQGTYMGPTGGLTPMNNPYEQQQMMMMQPPPPSAQSAPTKAASTKSRGKKKESMDPMQNMAAMANNPMMRPSMHNNMYPGQQQIPQGYPGQQMQYPPGYGQRPSAPPGAGYPPPGGPGGPYPQQYPPPNGGYPGYPPAGGGYHQGYGTPAQPPQYPGMAQPYPPPPSGQQVSQSNGQLNAQLKMPNSTMANGAGYGWPQQGQHDQYQNRHMSREQWMAAQEHRMQVLRQHMEQARYQMYMIESGQAPPNDRDYIRSNMMQIQNEMTRIHQAMSQQGYPMPGTGHDPSMTQMNMPPSSNPQQQPQATVSIQHQNSMTTNTPVHVTQSGAQVQPPEVGHTTINVIHQFGEPSSSNASETASQPADTKDSIPPEPIPTSNSYPPMDRSQSNVSNPYAPYPTPTSQTNGLGNGFSNHHQGMYNGYNNGPSASTTEALLIKNEATEAVDMKPAVVDDRPDMDVPPPAPLPAAELSMDEEDSQINRDEATPPMVMDEPLVEEKKEEEEEEEEEDQKPSTSEADSTMAEEAEETPNADSTNPDDEEEDEIDEEDEKPSGSDEKSPEPESTVADEEMPQESVQDSESQFDTPPEPSSVALSQESEQTTVSDEQAIPDSVKTDLAEPSEKADSVDGMISFTEPSTPAPAVKKPVRRPVVQRQRKRKNYDENDDDDDEFFATKKQKKAAKKNQDHVFEERPQSKWAEAVGDDELEDTIMTTDSVDTVNPDQQVVEKILNSKERENSGDEIFLIKWKNKAYKHCEWKTLKELEEVDKRVAAKVKRFKQKIIINDDDEDFNPDYTIVDRVVDITVGDEGVEFALVKWKSLGYDEVTYEPLNEVEKEWPDKLAVWRKRQIIDKIKLKDKPRPDEADFKCMNPNRMWKNENKLREYQFEGVDWLCYCWYKGQNCILADEMGLGKTVQSITFLNHVYEYGIHGPFLVVVPLSTIQHWVREFEAWTDMNAVVYHGSAHAREILQQYEVFYSKEHSGKQWKKNLVKLDVLITTFEVVVSDCEFLKKIPWKNCVIDEAHRLKNRNCKLLQSGLSLFRLDHRVLLTGTPLQNNIDELFSLLNFLHPEQFHSSVEFLNSYGQCESEAQVSALQDILKPMMLRRLKEDVEKTLQPKQETIIEVQLSDVQKKYYRAILERNFSHLCKGTSAPSLMNVMMELRKCCNHPFLIQGAEAMVIQDTKMLHSEYDEDQLWHQAALQSSGKLILIDKLLPKLRKDGHKVLIFSQMVKLLNILEDYLQYNNYPYERIDGNVRGDIRQASIDRFSRPDSDRFVFLLCTKAGGLGINLTAADTVIIFDSDWNPQNDLQAQARCHRIGQTKMVKVYRLITANTYEREMFDRASLKLGLDKAVLQSTTALKDSSTALNKKEIEDLLKKGAYGSIMDENNDGSKFSEEDIETILQRRSTTITLDPGQKGSLFSKATFNSQQNKGDDIDIDDPEFWNKWAEKAEVDVQKALATPDGRELILQEPRKRTKRFEENSLKEGEESDGSDEGGKRRKGKESSRKRKRDEDDQDYYRPDELSFNKSEYFKVQKLLGSWGWGRWQEMMKTGELDLSENDVIHMARTVLIHCCRDFRGDDRVKRTVWTLITPPGAKSGKGQNMYQEGWSVAPEYNPPNFAIDNSFQRNVHRNASKILVRVDQLYHLKKEVIGEMAKSIKEEKKYDEIEIKVPALPDPLCDGWDADCDKCLYIGAYKHGIDAVDTIRADPVLVFASKNMEPFPSAGDISNRFRRLISISQKEYLDPVYTKRPKFSKKDEQEFLRVFKNFGITEYLGDRVPPFSMDWTRFKQLSPNLQDKDAEELEEYFMCLLAYITKVTGGDLVGLDLKRANTVTEHLSNRKAQKILQRITGLRKLHKIVDNLDKFDDKFALCSMDTMPTGWTTEMDKQLLMVTHKTGLDSFNTHLLTQEMFQKIIKPPEKTLLKRVFDVINCFESGTWAGNFSVSSIDDSDEEGTPSRGTPVSIRGRGVSSSSKSRRSDDSKMRTALLQQSLLSMGNDAVAMAQLQLLLPLLLQSGATGSAQSQAALQMLAALLNTPGTSSSSSSAAAQQQQQLALLMMLLQSGQFDPELLGLPSGKKGSSSSSSSANRAAAEKAAAEKAAAEKAAAEKAEKEAQAQQQQFAALALLMQTACGNQPQSQTDIQKMIMMMQLETMSKGLGLSTTDIIALGTLHPDTKIILKNKKEGKSVEQKIRNIAQFLRENPDYKLDMASATSSNQASSSPKPSTSTTPAPALTPMTIETPAEGTPSAKPSAPSSPKGSMPTTSKNATPADTPAQRSPSTTPNKADAGEIKKSAGPSVQITASASGQLLTAYSIATGELLPVTKWPTCATVNEFLKNNPDCGIHSSSVTPELKLIASQYANRLGNEPATATLATEGATTTSSTPTPSTSNAVASTSTAVASSSKASTSGSSSSAAASSAQKELEMQLFLQQAAVQQMIVQQMFMQQAGLSAYGMPSTSSSKSDEVNPLVMQAMLANPMALQMMMSDPLMAAQLMAMSQTQASSSSKKSDKK